jgi:uncharacterized protein YjbI with pentapeptide repeats
VTSPGLDAEALLFTDRHGERSQLEDVIADGLDGGYEDRVPVLVRLMAEADAPEHRLWACAMLVSWGHAPAFDVLIAWARDPHSLPIQSGRGFADLSDALATSCLAAPSGPLTEPRRRAVAALLAIADHQPLGRGIRGVFLRDAELRPALSRELGDAIARSLDVLVGGADVEFDLALQIACLLMPLAMLDDAAAAAGAARLLGTGSVRQYVRNELADALGEGSGPATLGILERLAADGLAHAKVVLDRRRRATPPPPLPSEPSPGGAASSDPRGTLASLLAKAERARDLDLQHAELAGAELAGLRADAVDLSHANLSGASLARAQLVTCRLDFARLERASFEGATIRACRLEGVHAAGARFSGAYLEDSFAAGADLSGADFSGAHLSETIFARAQLRKAKLDGAEGTGVELRGADLSGASLVGAEFDDADFRGADLTGADLSGGSFEDADFRGAILDDVRWTDARRSDALLDAGASPAAAAGPDEVLGSLIGGLESVIETGGARLPTNEIAAVIGALDGDGAPDVGAWIAAAKKQLAARGILTPDALESIENVVRELETMGDKPPSPDEWGPLLQAVLGSIKRGS